MESPPCNLPLPIFPLEFYVTIVTWNYVEVAIKRISWGCLVGARKVCVQTTCDE